MSQSAAGREVAAAGAMNVVPLLRLEMEAWADQTNCESTVGRIRWGRIVRSDCFVVSDTEGAPSESDETVLNIIQTLVETKITIHVLGEDIPAAERQLQRRLAIDSLDRSIEFARKHYLIPRGIDVEM